MHQSHKKEDNNSTRRVLNTETTARKGKVFVNQVPLISERKIHCLSKLNAKVVAEEGSETLGPHQFSLLISTLNISTNIGLTNTLSIIPQ